MSSEGSHLELVLARNLIAALSTPAFVVDADAVMTFFNEAAGNLIGRRFDESGRLSREDWNAIGPVDEEGRPTPSERLPLTVALRDGRPSIGVFRIKTDDGSVLEVEASAIPLCSAEGFRGALVTFVSAAGDRVQSRRDTAAEAAPVSAPVPALASVPAAPAEADAIPPTAALVVPAEHSPPDEA